MRGPVPAPLGVVYIDRVDLLGGVCRSVGGGICSPVGWQSSSSRLQRRRDGYRCTLCAPSYSSESLGPFGAGAKRSEVNGWSVGLPHGLSEVVVSASTARPCCEGGVEPRAGFTMAVSSQAGFVLDIQVALDIVLVESPPSESSESGKHPELAGKPPLWGCYLKHAVVSYAGARSRFVRRRSEARRHQETRDKQDCGR